MPVVWKHLLSPGTYMTEDGPVTFDAAQVREMYRSGKRMLKEQVSIPIPLEHQEGVRALTRGEMDERLEAVQRQFAPQELARQNRAELRARTVANNTGFVAGFRQDGDDLLVGLGVEWLPGASSAAEIEHRLKNTIKYVSPRIEPLLRDGDGKTYRYGISHVALTPRPVFQRQRPFGGTGTALLSRAEVPAFGAATGPVQLSLLDRIDLGGRMPFPPKKAGKPSKPEPAEDDDYSQGDEDQDDLEEDEDDDPEAGDLDGSPDDLPEQTTPDGKAPPKDWQAMGETALVQHVRRQLEQKEGICLPPTVHTAFDLASHLATILDARHASTATAAPAGATPMDPGLDPDPNAGLDPDPDAGLDDEDEDPEDPEDPDAVRRKKRAGAREEPMVVSMSRETTVTYDARLATLEADNAALRKGAILTETDSLVERGQMSPARGKTIRDLLADGAFCLSLARREKPAEDARITAWLEVARETPEGTYLTPEGRARQLSRASQPGEPPDLGSPKDARPDAYVMAGLTGGRWVPPAA